MKSKDIARVCHEANRAICEASGDGSQVPWKDAEKWQVDSAIEGVEYKMKNPDATAADQHDAWCESKLNAGWVYGLSKNADAKTHPCLVPYDQLPFNQKVKDHVFASIVIALGYVG